MRPVNNTANTDATEHTTMENIRDSVRENVENLTSKVAEGVEKVSHVAHEA